MFGYWLTSRARRPSAFPAATVSILFHGALITGWVVATLPGSDARLPADSFSNKPPHYLPPPDKAPPGRGTPNVPEHVSYFEMTPPRPLGMGDDARKPQPVIKPQQIVLSDSLPVLAHASRPEALLDSVFTELEVDTPVRLTSSAAPDYPPALLKQNVEGKVVARWVIDTTGRADTASFELIQATRPEFAAAVKAVLPRMKFVPARIGNTPVRQMVEQSIAFKIQAPPPAPVKPGDLPVKPVPAGMSI